MKKIPVLFLLAILLNPALSRSEETDPVLNVGIGAFYSGIGLSYRLALSPLQNFVSVGCFEIGYSSSQGMLSSCGGGVASMLPFSENRRHSAGVYGGVVYDHFRYSRIGLAYVGSLVYSYHFNQIDSRGWNIHGGPSLKYSPFFSSRSDRFSRGIVAGFGYQF